MNTDKHRDPTCLMRMIAVAVIAGAMLWLLMAWAALAQTATGTGQASAASNSASGSIAAVNIGGSPARVAATTEYSGSYRIESAPNVSAPAVFGGGHPCLAGKSGGFSVIGGGASYGQGEAEPACMAWVMGQPELAFQIMYRGNPQFRRAACDIGFYRVGGRAIKLDCGKKTVDFSAAGQERISTKTGVYPQSVCEKVGSKLRYSRDAIFADAASAKANCKRILKR